MRQLAALPLIGALPLILGGLLAFGASRLLGYDDRETGSMVACGASSNLGAIGSLLCLLFWGEPGFALATLARLFEAIVTFGLAWPACRFIGTGERTDGRRIWRGLLDPAVLLPLIGVALGLALRGLGWQRPGALAPVNSALVMAGTALLMLATGASIRLRQIGGHWPAAGLLAGIKFGVSPTAAYALGRAAGLHAVEGGLPLRVLLVLSSMPVAFTALIPPTLFGLNEDLANTAWLLTTIALVAVVPVLAGVLL